MHAVAVGGLQSGIEEVQVDRLSADVLPGKFQSIADTERAKQQIMSVQDMLLDTLHTATKPIATMARVVDTTVHNPPRLKPKIPSKRIVVAPQMSQFSVFFTGLISEAVSRVLCVMTLRPRLVAIRRRAAPASTSRAEGNTARSAGSRSFNVSDKFVSFISVWVECVCLSCSALKVCHG